MADPKELAKKAEEELAQKKAGLGAKIKGVQINPGAVKFIAEHTVADGETLSQIALKFYKNSGREFWMKIYEANKPAIGDNPGMLKPGTVLKIPEI